YQRICEQLVRLWPDDPDVTLGLAGAYLSNLYPLLALRTFGRFLERWPGHGRADEVRATVSDLEAKLPDLLGDIGLTGDDAVEIATLHEEGRALLEAGRFAAARR